MGGGEGGAASGAGDLGPGLERVVVREWAEEALEEEEADTDGVPTCYTQLCACKKEVQGPMKATVHRPVLWTPKLGGTHVLDSA